ncbi:hypothetical protein Tco_1161804, partial [Tanacetum coccineum]
LKALLNGRQSSTLVLGHWSIDAGTIFNKLLKEKIVLVDDRLNTVIDERPDFPQNLTVETL